MKGPNNIFSSSRHLTKEEILSYAHHSLPKQQIHEIEKHLTDCEMCSDAVEGSKKIGADSNLLKITAELQKMARKRKLVRKKIFSGPELISIFAVVFLILFLLIVAVLLFIKK